MLRKIIRPTSEFYSIHIPKEYINHEVEILVLPFSYPPREQKNSGKLKNKSFAGALSKYADLSLLENEKDVAWAQVAKDKNDLS